MDRDALRRLLTRLEAAEGPDRYLDCWIACALDGFFPVLKEWPGRDGPIWRVDLCCYRDGGRVSPGHGGDQMVQPYTASFDQALALVERLGFSRADIIWFLDAAMRAVSVPAWCALPFANALAIALLGALLKALIAREVAADAC